MKKRMILLLTVVASILCLAGCGNKAVEIQEINASAEKETLSVQVKSNKDVAAKDCKVKIYLTQDNDTVKGTVYRTCEIKEDLKKKQRVLYMYFTSAGAWDVKGNVTYKGNQAKDGDKIMISNALTEFGSGAKLKVSFLIDGDVVAEKTITLE
ncbi:MAG: hypothetical protein J6S79_09260 [Lachnospiraceae bacterium]|nr:hypothetical protein [Lachnospiraceae bacterium]